MVTDPRTTASGGPTLVRMIELTLAADTSMQSVLLVEGTDPTGLEPPTPVVGLSVVVVELSAVLDVLDVLDVLVVVEVLVDAEDAGEAFEQAPAVTDRTRIPRRARGSGRPPCVMRMDARYTSR